MEIAALSPLGPELLPPSYKTEPNQEFGAELGKLYTEFKKTRSQTETLCAPLQPEDYGIQAMPDVSPPKWHLAHTSWFYEEFILKEFVEGYVPFNREYAFLFNSYYETAGSHVSRDKRGILSRPSLEEIQSYRKSID